MPLTSWSACGMCSSRIRWLQASHSLTFPDCHSNTVDDRWCHLVLDAVVSQNMPMILSIGIVHSCRVACRASDIVVPFLSWIREAAKTGHSGYDQWSLPQLPDGPQSHDDALYYTTLPFLWSTIGMLFWNLMCISLALDWTAACHCLWVTLIDRE